MPESLWPAISIDNEQTPLDLLKEQGTLLEKATSNKIVGEVETVAEGQLFKHKFYIVPKYVKNYRFLMIEIIHGLYLYPVFYYDHTLKIERPRTQSAIVKKTTTNLASAFDSFALMYDTIPSDIPTPDLEIDNFDQFKEQLQKTFSSETTISILKTLLFQSK